MTKKNTFTNVIKRDGRKVFFDVKRIKTAVSKTMIASREGDLAKDPDKITAHVIRILSERYPTLHTPHIEEIQDAVEEVLVLEDFPKTAKAYILYRNERAHLREQKKIIPAHVQKLAKESKKYFKNGLGEFVYYRTYSRWIESEGRRETWIETIDRFMNFMKENLGDKLNLDEYKEIQEAILKQEVMPSMRLLWSAGAAASSTNVAAYNCSFIAPTKLEDFAEIMYISMCGTGVGFSVESEIVQQLPIVKRQTNKKLKTHVVEDSKEGWCNAVTVGLKTWYSGKDIDFDFSKVRPSGAKLKTMGGRSSGPEPLKDLMGYMRKKTLANQGKRLSNIDVHDLICKIGEVVVAGGVRRSAMISLSDLDDWQMRDAKKGQFYLTEPHRSMANNSVVYNEKPSTKQFMDEWLALAKSGSGERGMFNRAGLEFQLPKRRWKVFKKHCATSGTNPCGEIVLRSKQFCNLTEVVSRCEDTRESLLRKVKLATILGTYQATLTDFPYLSPEWKKNCEEEALLGVSVTGQWDCPAARDASVLRALREKAIETNHSYAARFGINPSTCITCVKPSGTVSQLVDTASGMHPRYAKYYIRRIRISATDPLFHMLRDQKYPYFPEVGQSKESATTFIFEFPIKAPKGSICKEELTSKKQLEHWKKVKENFTEHNPSVTIYVNEDEWISTSNWLYQNWEMLGGLSFLPHEDHVYKLAPYEEITKEQYEEMVDELPKVDFSQILSYEKEDKTQGAKEYACMGNTCELGLDEINQEEETVII